MGLSDTWHVSNTGDNSAGGTITDPFETIGFAIAASQPGDTILLKRGEVFRESDLLIENQRTLAAYGKLSDPLPVICGSRIVSGWSRVSPESNLYQAALSEFVSNGEPMFFLNGERQTLARYPNTGWLRVDSGTDSAKIVDLDLKADPDWASVDWAGGQVRWRKWSWWYETRPIRSDDGVGVLSLSGSSSISNLTGIGGGYYIDNHFSALDFPGEWYWDRSAGQLYLKIPEGVDPSTMLTEMAVASRGISLYDSTLMNVHLRHYTDVGVKVSRGGVIEECLIEHIWNKGIDATWNAAGSQVRGNIIRDILNVGIYWNENPSGSGGSVVELNHLVRCGTVPGLGGSGPWHAAGVIISNAPFRSKGVQFRLNRIEGTGYAGIILGADGQTVERNVFIDTMNTLNDGAAVYTNCSYSFIRDNIILETEGDLDSSHPWTPLGAGIWLEFLSNFHHSQVTGNTVYGCGGDGLYLPNNFNCLIEGNIFLSNLRAGTTLGGHGENRSEDQPDQAHFINDNLFGIGAVPWFPAQPRNNAAWARDNDTCLTFKTYSNLDLDFGTMSGTTFLTPDGVDLVTRTNSGEISIAQWQELEADWADPSPKVVEGAGYLFINDSVETVDFPLPGDVSWTDLDGVPMNSTISIEPFRSIVLLAFQGVVPGLEPYHLYTELTAFLEWDEWLAHYKLSGEDARSEADPDNDS